MLFEQEPSPAVRKVLDACLILHAEHTMNASTFSGRVTGSTLANPYTVISSAIGTLTGPLHGGANEEVLDMLDEIGTIENVRAWLEDAIANKKKIMGFGHRVYKVKDPRATVLQELAEHVFAETGRPPTVRDGDRNGKASWPACSGPKGIYPNVDFYSGIVYQSLGIPARPVHADLRHRPRRRLAGPLAGTAAEQPHLPARADLRRQARRAVRAAGEASVNAEGIDIALKTANPSQWGRLDYGRATCFFAVVVALSCMFGFTFLPWEEGFRNQSIRLGFQDGGSGQYSGLPGKANLGAVLRPLFLFVSLSPGTKSYESQDFRYHGFSLGPYIFDLAHHSIRRSWYFQSLRDPINFDRRGRFQQSRP